MSALFPLGVRWHALGHVDFPPSLHTQSRDAGRLADWQAEGEMSRIGLRMPLNADGEIKRDQQSTTHK